ncbi:cyclophilin-like fold protein [uncultured Desulfosarcina sp.]|uniref:cyclophilin-like fold protein n=1 Tax=uncultured Desulfosarcina sp. TaxID=218289 RepID=UPI0029C6F90B|nr:cyclophilin-like fold protein [uncultured Desulfosarcina sp.]
MNRIIIILFAGLVMGSFAAQAQGLRLSDMQVQITSNGRSASFQLYETTAAKEFYDQLPLELDLTNFRDAQWMFYPPERLNVTAREAYHDGKKGELGYYEPWGDVFMLYKDFYAGDEMHRLGINVTGIEEIAGMSGKAIIEKNEPNAPETKTAMKISVTANRNTTVFELNNSGAAKSLYAQLPLRIKVENYGSNEKIFYSPKKLDTADTPQAAAHETGTLAYYAPWGDVVMFYGDFGPAPGLYELGHAISGAEYIRRMSGWIRIERCGVP